MKKEENFQVLIKILNFLHLKQKVKTSFKFITFEKYQKN